MPTIKIQCTSLALEIMKGAFSKEFCAKTGWTTAARMSFWFNPSTNWRWGFYILKKSTYVTLQIVFLAATWETAISNANLCENRRETWGDFVVNERFSFMESVLLWQSVDGAVLTMQPKSFSGSLTLVYFFRFLKETFALCSVVKVWKQALRF